MRASIEPPERARRRVDPAIRVLVGVGVIGLIAATWVGWRALAPCDRCAGLVGAAGMLRSYASAQTDFYFLSEPRSYWRKDVAGLYAFAPPGDARPIELIEPSLAGADAAPVLSVAARTPLAPKDGYWIKTLRFAGEDPAKPDPERFAACAFPDSRSAGHHAFIVSHQGAVYRRPWSGSQDTPLVFPLDPLKEGWEPAR